MTEAEAKAFCARRPGWKAVHAPEHGPAGNKDRWIAEYKQDGARLGMARNTWSGQVILYLSTTESVGHSVSLGSPPPRGRDPDEAVQLALGLLEKRLAKLNALHAALTTFEDSELNTLRDAFQRVEL